jgi:hypothetical protein
MAVEAYIVAFDIQRAGSGYQVAGAPVALLGAKEEGKVGTAEFEGNGTTEPGLLTQVGSSVARCMLAEVEASSAAEAVEVVRARYAQNTGGERAVVKPNKTNFKMVA